MTIRPSEIIVTKESDTSDLFTFQLDLIAEPTAPATHQGWGPWEVNPGWTYEVELLGQPAETLDIAHVGWTRE